MLIGRNEAMHEASSGDFDDKGPTEKESGISSAPPNPIKYRSGGRDGGLDCDPDADVQLTERDEQRLREAFLLAADEGLGTRSESALDRDIQMLHLPTRGLECLRKFTIIAASLGFKCNREELCKDFEEVVRANGLVDASSVRLWRGACDTDAPIIGFTYEVFKRYYIAKIQRNSREADIRQAWEDLHYGTGGKRMADESSNERHANSTPSSSSKDDTRDGSSDRRAYITRAELQKLLTREGEVLTDEEVDELLRECRPDEAGRITYEGYRRMLIDPSL